jgi:hypothetical protein
MNGRRALAGCGKTISAQQKVYGLKRAPSPKPKERVSASPPAKTPADKVTQTLIQKGLLSEEERRARYQ